MFKRCMVACLLVVACGEDEPSEAEACEADAKWVGEHDSCQTDNDCVFVGGCSGWGMYAVATKHEAAARKRAESSMCQQFDGPTYNTRCGETKHCELVPTGRYCGQPLDSGNDSGFSDAGDGN
ncbi:MAG: hypothetical protein ABW352_17305 [Polyangiales bacterium]